MEKKKIGKEFLLRGVNNVFETHSWIIWILRNLVESSCCQGPQRASTVLLQRWENPRLATCYDAAARSSRNQLSFLGLCFSHAASRAIVWLFKVHSIYYSSAVLVTDHTAMNKLNKALFSGSSRSSVKGKQRTRKQLIKSSRWGDVLGRK